MRAVEGAANDTALGPNPDALKRVFPERMIFDIQALGVADEEYAIHSNMEIRFRQVCILPGVMQINSNRVYAR